MQLSCPKSTLGSTWEKQFKLIKYIFDREVLGAKSEPSFPDLENTVWKVVLHNVSRSRERSLEGCINVSPF